MKKTPLVTLAIPLLFGCVSNSTVTPYGNGLYIMAIDDISSFTSPDALKVEGVKRANAHCGGKRKKAIVQEVSGGGLQGWTTTSASVIFRCA